MSESYEYFQGMFKALTICKNMSEITEIMSRNAKTETKRIEYSHQVDGIQRCIAIINQLSDELYAEWKKKNDDAK